MSLFNNDLNMAGVYRAILTRPDSKENKRRLYIPSIHSMNPYELSEDEFEEALQILPEGRFIAPETPENDIPCYVMFEGGSIKYPRVIGYMSNIIQNNGSGNGFETNNESGTNTGTPEIDSSINNVNGNGWLWPCTASRTVTSPFGKRYHPLTGKYTMHNGIDIGGPDGCNIVAAKSGTVIVSEYSSSYGHYIIVNHDGGYTTTYAHLSSRLVSVGASVSQGQVIGKEGSTGWSTGPHLHFEVSINGVRYNPLNYVN